ncbi:MAG TPA: hypothetical protein VN693_08580 [Rhodanobacteraceae bacterium]|nr:hypothetical protein [Rhodanobacteraceae bacterium]
MATAGAGTDPRRPEVAASDAFRKSDPALPRSKPIPARTCVPVTSYMFHPDVAALAGFNSTRDSLNNRSEFIAFALAKFFAFGDNRIRASMKNASAHRKAIVRNIALTSHRYDARVPISG